MPKSLLRRRKTRKIGLIGPKWTLLTSVSKRNRRCLRRSRQIRLRSGAKRGNVRLKKLRDRLSPIVRTKKSRKSFNS